VTARHPPSTVPTDLPRARVAPADDASVGGAATGGAATPAGRRRAARALGDDALARALATGDAAAWAEFDLRFRPLLEAYARRVRIPLAWWPQCVDEVLEDEAMRLADGGRLPDQMGAYLVRAAYHRLLKAKRAAVRRERRYGACAPEGDSAAERVVQSVCSAAALRASGGTRAADGGPAAWDDAAGADASPASAVLARAAATLAARLTDVERQMLVWVAEQVPRRQIAEWVGDGYEATRKRIQRLTRRLQADAWRLAADLPAAERHELERFLRRAARATSAPTASASATSAPAVSAPAPPAPATAARTATAPAAGDATGAARAGAAASTPRAAPSRGTRP
jgi:DNA-binding CsgD family transcriptional regulator